MRWEIGKANGPLITRTSKPIIIRRIHPKRRKALNYYTRVTIPPGWNLLIRAQWPAALINVERDCEVSSGREKKSRGHSTLDLVHLPMPATRPLDFHSNRVGHRAGWQPQSGNRANFRPVPTRPSPFNAEFRLFPSFSFFLSSFFYSAIERTQEREERGTSESFRATRSWNRGIVPFLVTWYIFAKNFRESRRNGLKPRFSLFLPSTLAPARFSSKYGKSIFEKVGNGRNARNF